MKNIISTLLLLQFLTTASIAAEFVQLAVNENTLSCASDTLKVSAPNISHLVKGSYPGFNFQAANFSHPCFYRNYIIDKAQQNSGQLEARVEVTTRITKEPIYSCKPKPCPFCDPADCNVVGHKEYTEESVYIDILGIRFYAKSKLAKTH